MAFYAVASTSQSSLPFDKLDFILISDSTTNLESFLLQTCTQHASTHVFDLGTLKSDIELNCPKIKKINDKFHL